MRKLHLIGFGSQGQAWAQNLRDSGWDVQVYLSRLDSPSAIKAGELGFRVATLSAFHCEDGALIAMLVPDDKIASIYNELRLPTRVALVLAHGYAVYSGELKPKLATHLVTLLAPKAIGPELRRHYQEAHARGERHGLSAAFSHPELTRPLAQGLGFDDSRLVETTAETEAIGDLISEQGLLCGGVFTLMDWTMEAMRKAGVPPRLIQEECITELLLIVNLIKARGLEPTLRAISQAALAGASRVNETLEASSAKSELQALFERVQDKRFVNDFRSRSWQTQAEKLAQRLSNHDRFLAGATKGQK